MLDPTGNIVRINDSAGEWRPVTLGSMIEKLFVPGCDLIKEKTNPTLFPNEKSESEKVALFAYDFAQDLEKAKDLKPLLHSWLIALQVRRSSGHRR